MRLPHHELDSCRIEGREELPPGVGLEPLDGDSLGAQHSLAPGFEAVLAPGEPRDPGFDEELPAGLRLELPPEVPGAPRRARIPGVVAVRVPDQA